MPELQLQHVVEKLSAVATKLESLDEKYDLLQTGLTDRLTHIDRKVSEQNRMLFTDRDCVAVRLAVVERDLKEKIISDGNVRIDRLEKASASTAGFKRMAIGAVIAAAVEIAFKFVHLK